MILQTRKQQLLQGPRSSSGPKGCTQGMGETGGSLVVYSSFVSQSPLLGLSGFVYLLLGVEEIELPANPYDC